MVNELKSMNKDAGVQASVNLLTLATSQSAVNKKIQASVYFKVLAAVQNLSGKNPDAKVMFKALGEEDKGILSQFSDMAGIYTYNFNLKDFDFEANPNADAIVFNFPASLTSKNAGQNDGQLTISKPQVVQGPFSALGSSISELPTELKYVLKVSGNTVTSYSFTASYQADGIPTAVESKLSLGDFVFKVTYGYKSTELSLNYSFTHGSTTILDMGATVGGTLTKEAIDSAFITTTVYDTTFFNYDINDDGVVDKNDNYINEYDQTKEYPERVISNANAHFQFMDVKIAGMIDFKNFMKDIRNAEDLNLPQDSAPAIINRNANLIVVYASDNKAIAKAEAYLTTEDSQDFKCDDLGCREVTVKDTIVDVRMIFADGSKQDLKTYFDNGFDKTIDSFNEFIDELNRTYNWKIEVGS